MCVALLIDYLVKIAFLNVVLSPTTSAVTPVPLVGRCAALNPVQKMAHVVVLLET
jgi:hypothetical protein